LTPPLLFLPPAPLLLLSLLSALMTFIHAPHSRG
jgi:hypothetical protein